MKERRINVAFVVCMTCVWIGSVWWRTFTYNNMMPFEFTWCAWVLCQGLLTGLIGWYLGRGIHNTESKEAKHGCDPSTPDRHRLQ